MYRLRRATYPNIFQHVLQLGHLRFHSSKIGVVRVVFRLPQVNVLQPLLKRFLGHFPRFGVGLCRHFVLQLLADLVHLVPPVL